MAAFTVQIKTKKANEDDSLENLFEKSSMKHVECGGGEIEYDWTYDNLNLKCERCDAERTVLLDPEHYEDNRLKLVNFLFNGKSRELILRAEKLTHDSTDVKFIKES